MTIATETLRKDFGTYGTDLQNAVQNVLRKPNAKRKAFDRLLDRLPVVQPSVTRLDQDWVTIGRQNDLSADQAEELKQVLRDLKPWRKGPFDFFGLRIDSEWNSALKWQRVLPHVKPLQNRKVLDVGSSNGYYLFRMASAQPRLVLGIEPYATYFYQYTALQRYLRLPRMYCLPLGLEELPKMDQWFDTIFCMGILYHRRSPLDTLAQLKAMLSKDGQLVLETLIIPGEDETALIPRDRYASMRNVYFVPTVNGLKNWLQRCGYANIRCVNITPTTHQEQRKTPWIDSESLASFLDPCNHTRTVEGYPAPLRAVMIAEAP